MLPRHRLHRPCTFIRIGHKECPTLGKATEHFIHVFLFIKHSMAVPHSSAQKTVQELELLQVFCSVWS